VIEPPFLELRDVTKRFPGHVAVDGLSLAVPRGQLLALLGPSGSGKTTTLRILAGFERPDTGAVVMDGTDVTALAPAARRIGMVFQHYALFPHLSVGENVAFGIPRAPDRTDRVRRLLSLVDLTGFEERRIDALSGGQQQRVALARALAPEPKLLLLDEPLSNLDPALRERTRRELRSALEAVGITTVLVTHEQEEAFALGDVIAVLRDGRLEQFGTAPDLYERPATYFVATFVGRAATVPGLLVAADRVRVAEGVEWPVRVPRALALNAVVRVVVRPEALRFHQDLGIPGAVRSRRYLGGRALFAVDTAVGVLEVEAATDAVAVGRNVRVMAERADAFPTDEP
jgi:putative spermidine/putrescine transport system ATP-binding protein